MVAYAIIQVDVHDPETFKKYQAKVPAIIKQCGGRYLVRGGTQEVLSGTWPTDRTVVLEFPTLEQAREWHEGDIYAGPRAIRDASANVTCVIVEGVDKDPAAETSG